MAESGFMSSTGTLAMLTICIHAGTQESIHPLSSRVMSPSWASGVKHRLIHRLVSRNGLYVMDSVTFTESATLFQPAVSVY